MKDKMIKAIEVIVTILCAALFVWIIFSYGDIILHNTGSCHYQPWNFFTWFIEKFS